MDFCTVAIDAIALFTVGHAALCFAAIVARRHRTLTTAAPATTQLVAPTQESPTAIALVITVDELPDPWELPLAPTTPTAPVARAVVEPSFAKLLPPARNVVELPLQLSFVGDAAQPVQPNLKALTVPKLRELCKAAGIKWSRTGQGGKHLTKAEMIQRLTA